MSCELLGSEERTEERRGKNGRIDVFVLALIYNNHRRKNNSLKNKKTVLILVSASLWKTGVGIQYSCWGV